MDNNNNDNDNKHKQMNKSTLLIHITYTRSLLSSLRKLKNK